MALVTGIAWPGRRATQPNIHRPAGAPGRVCVLTSAHPVFDVRIFHKQCRALVRAGFDVTLVAPHGGDESVAGVRVVAVPRRVGRLWRGSLGALGVLRAALRVGATVYHFHDPELIPVGMLLSVRGKRVIYDVHEDVPAAILSRPYLPGWSRPLVSWLAGRVMRLGARFFAAIVPATPAIAHGFSSLRRRTVIVQNFPSLAEFPAEPTRPWSERRPAVAYLGLMSEIRGVVEMVGAMGRLPTEISATLDIAGHIETPALRSRLEMMPGWDRVVDHGVLRRGEIAELLNEVRAGLVLFHHEPNHVAAYPTKMFEYMAAGLPVIASDFPLWRRIIEEAGCGIVVNPRDPDAIAGAIRYILSHDRDAEAMGRAGRTAVVQRYSWEAEEPKLIALYRQLLDEARGNGT